MFNVYIILFILSLFISSELFLSLIKSRSRWKIIFFIASIIPGAASLFKMVIKEIVSNLKIHMFLYGIWDPYYIVAGLSFCLMILITVAVSFLLTRRLNSSLLFQKVVEGAKGFEWWGVISLVMIFLTICVISIYLVSGALIYTLWGHIYLRYNKLGPFPSFMNLTEDGLFMCFAAGLILFFGGFLFCLYLKDRFGLLD